MNDISLTISHLMLTLSSANRNVFQTTGVWQLQWVIEALYL